MDGFQLGPLHIYWYSICLLAAVWVAYAIALRQKKRLGNSISQAALTDVVLFVLVAGVVGGRLGYVIQNWDYFSYRLVDVLYVNSGGLSIHGALLGGAFALYLYAKRHQLRLLSLTDLLVLPVLAGQIIGRLGNYFNQELYGYPTQLPWKIFIDPDHRLPPYSQSAFYHPVFLYEMMLNAIGFLILWRIKPKKAGQLTGGYLLVFAISRFVTEFWRISDRVLWGLSTAQILSLVIAVVSYPQLLGTADDIFKKFQNSLANLRENWDRSRDKKH